MKKLNNITARILAALTIATLMVVAAACTDHHAPVPTPETDGPTGPTAPLTALAAAPAAGTLAQTYGEGELTITITHGGANHTYTYQHTDSGGGAWNIADLANAPRLAAGVYPATAEGWLTIPFDDPKYPESAQDLPVSWAGNITVGIDPATDRAVMQGTIALVPATARMGVTLTGAWGEGDLAATEEFSVILYKVNTYPNSTWDKFSWQYPRQPYSTAHILPQTLTGPRQFIGLRGLTNKSKYEFKTYKIDLPPGISFTFEAGHQYTLNITLDAKAGTATLTGITIAPFADGGTPALDDARPGIRTPQDLIDFSNDWNQTGLDAQKIADVLKKWADDTGTIRLLADINMSTAGNFTPIGKDDANRFTGKFDGGGHTITGLTVNVVNTNRQAGLFGKIDGAYIRRVRLVGASINGDRSVGGIVGESERSTLAGCTVQGDIGAGAVYAYAGGIAGNIYQSQVIACAFTGQLTAYGVFGSCAGGIAAQTIESTLTGCYTHITSIGGGDEGGIAGQNYSDTTFAGNVFLTTGGITAGIGTGGTSPENTGATALTPELVEKMNTAIAGGTTENKLRLHLTGDNKVVIYETH